MGKKGKGKSTEEVLKKKAQKALKQEKKTQKSAEKVEKKQKKINLAPQEELEEDIDAILAELAKQDEARQAITEEHCDPPSRRSCGVLVANPVNLNELVLFGGEHFDGQKVTLFNDLFVYNVEKNEWRKIISPNTPSPRSSHQLVVTPAGRGFMFGGEFVSPNQTTFFHYKDFWSLDFHTYAWEKLEVGKKPSPRSGHRMILWKHLIVLFGGFYDAGKETKYLDDLHIFDTFEGKWHAVEVPEPKPTKRSGFNLAIHGDTILLYGGYTKETVKGQKTPRGVVHNDIWVLKMSFELDTLRWERRKKGGIMPQPRCGASMTSFKGKGVMFGGVTDIKEDDETLESNCLDELFQYNIGKLAHTYNKGLALTPKTDQGRFYPMTLRKKNPNEAEVRPSPRFNTMICAQRSNLYLFGGIQERGDQEITFADFWTIDLDKLVSFNSIIEDPLAQKAWLGQESDDEDVEEDDEGSEDEDDDDDEAEEDDENSEGEAEKSKPIDVESPTVESIVKTVKETVLDPTIPSNSHSPDGEPVEEAVDDELLKQQQAQNQLEEENQPRATDPALRDYFSRTSDYWFGKALEACEKADMGRASMNAKGLRREAFSLAEIAWNESEPRLEEERKILEENEVVQSEASRKNEGERRSRRI